jgi:hypothetical protein
MTAVMHSQNVVAALTQKFEHIPLTEAHVCHVMHEMTYLDLSKRQHIIEPSPTRSMGTTAETKYNNHDNYTFSHSGTR